MDGTDSESGDAVISRRQLLQTTGGTVALGVLGTQSVLGDEHGCDGVPPEEPPADLPEVDLRGDSPEATTISDTADEVLVYIYGYNTFEDEGRQQAATLKTALEAQEYDHPLVAVQWDSAPTDEELGLLAEAGNLEAAEENADEEALMLADWLEETFEETTIRFVAYSLGARLALRTLTHLDTVDVDTVSLLGGALASQEVCTDSDEFSLDNARAVFSYHSRQDWLICGSFSDYLDFAQEDRSSPALGCEGSTCNGTLPSNFLDRDVTDTVGESHCAYLYPDIGIVPEVVADFDAEPEDDSDEEDAADVVVSLNNVGSTAWEVTGVEGDDDMVPGSDVVGTENPPLQLEAGTRYRVENGGWSAHPLAFRDASDNTLLSQDATGLFEADESVDWVDEGEWVAFTLTDTLAEALDNYVCTAHPSMSGLTGVDPATGDAEQADDTEESADEGTDDEGMADDGGEAGEGGDDEETDEGGDDGFGPGLGIPTALGSLGGLGYLLVRRVRDENETE